MNIMVKGLLALVAGGLVGVMGIAGLALAQTPGKPAAEEASAAELAEKVEIITRAKVTADVPLNEPRAIDLGLVRVPGIDRSLTEGVTAKAYTRYVAVQGKNIGQVVLVGVEKNGRQESLNSADFTAQFDLTKPQIDPAAEVAVKGDRAQLKEALERLAAAPEKKEKEEPTVAKQTNAAQQGGGGGQKQNDIAGGYQTPSAIAVAPEPEESVQVSTDGCTIRIDVAQLQAIQQSKSVTTKGGAVQSETACSDSNETYPLQRSYSVCSDQVDIDARKATAQFKLFYVNKGAATVEVSDCAPDPDKVFNIVEQFEGCTIQLDYAEKLAVPRSSLIYVNQNNSQVQVRGCEPSEAKAAVPLVATTDVCSIRHNFPGSTSHQQGTYIYTLEGVTYQAGTCTDNGTVYPHSKVYTDAAGAYICQPVVNPQAQTVALQSRIRITVNGLSQYITDCTPDSSTLNIQSTTEGCADPSTWTHDLAAGQSFVQERFFFLDNSQRKYITNCQNSNVMIQHFVETTGWQHHDAQLFSYPLKTVYITPASGRYDIKTSEVLQGAVQMPYELMATEDRPSGATTYQGCDAYRETAKVEVYERPDGSEYLKPIGAGETVGPTNVCVSTLVNTQRIVMGWRYVYHPENPYCYSVGESDACDYPWYRHSAEEDVQKFEVKNTETGQVVSTTCKMMHNNFAYYTGGQIGGTVRWNAQWNAGQWHSGDWGPSQGQTVSVPPCPY